MTDIRNRLFAGVALVVFVGLLLQAEARAQKTLIITMDDVSGIDYPSVDSLSDAAYFHSFYVQPMCQPTRASLNTGRRPWRTRNGDNTTRGLTWSETTIMEATPDAFHALIGKWHLGRRVSISPLLQGHDLFSGQMDNPGDHWNYDKRLQFPWIDVPLPPTGYSTTEITDEAIQMLGFLPEEWVLQVHYYAAHRPWGPPPGYQDGSDYEDYLNMVEYMGKEIERLLTHVDLDETLVLLFSDNGSGFHHGRGKGSVFQPAINVPLIVGGTFAGQPIPSGPRADLVSVEDLFATVLENHGETSIAEDSISLGPTLVTGVLHARTETLSERFRKREPPYRMHLRAAVTTRFGETFKLHHDCVEGEYRLYNLSQDPGETNRLNLWGPEFDFLSEYLRENNDCE